MAEELTLFERSPSSPGELLRSLLQEKGWTQDELATITGRSRQQIIDIASDRRGITAEMAVVLAAAFGNAPDVWLNLDASYRLSRTDEDASAVQRRARIFELAPVKDMQKRGWITPGKSVEDIDAQLRNFFGVESLDAEPEFPVAMRKTAPLSDLTPPQRAWCFRARQLANSLLATGFDRSKMGELKRELRRLAAYPSEAKKVPELLQKYGIRFVVIEPLPGAKIDGAAFWLDEQSPVIAVSARFDRVDSFWFTLFHELAHIEHGDGLSVDANLSGEDEVPSLMKDEMERRADETAAAALIAPDELLSFVRRTGPIYAKPNIVQFAHRIKIHPGIIVGQLQRRGEIGWSAHREMLAKVRSHVTSAALTDGWGHDITPGTV